MKFATWNVNSLKVRLPQVVDWLTAHRVDVLCLQEIKLSNAQFPSAEFEALDYRSVYAGQKSYNGVAILARTAISFDETDVIRNIPGFNDPQQRLIAATLAGIRVLCAYFPNGQAPGTDKFAYKLEWIDALCNWLTKEIIRYPKLALMGDYNIAPAAVDVCDPFRWEGLNLFSPDERAAFARLCALGLVDAFRCFAQEEKSYTWWDYRAGALRRNAGLRIDHILLSSPLAAACVRCTIDKTPRRWPQPSDHVPVIAEIEMSGIDG